MAGAGRQEDPAGRAAVKSGRYLAGLLLTFKTTANIALEHARRPGL